MATWKILRLQKAAKSYQDTTNKIRSLANSPSGDGETVAVDVAGDSVRRR